MGNIVYTCDVERIRESLSNAELRRNAERLLIACGISPSQKGFSWYVDAIIISGTERYISDCDIYALQGRLYGVSFRTVTRAVSRITLGVKGAPSGFTSLIGQCLTRDKICNGLIIAYLGRLLVTPELICNKKTEPC